MESHTPFFGFSMSWLARQNACLDARNSSANPRISLEIFHKPWKTSMRNLTTAPSGTLTGHTPLPLASFVEPSWGHIDLSGLQLALGGSCWSPQGFQVGPFTSSRPPPDLEAVALTVFGKLFAAGIGIKVVCIPPLRRRASSVQSFRKRLAAGVVMESHASFFVFVYVFLLARQNACLDAQNYSANPRISLEIFHKPWKPSMRNLKLAPRGTFHGAQAPPNGKLCGAILGPYRLVWAPTGPGRHLL